MIFASLNEKGVPAWKAILKNEKTVTRRRNPVPIGKMRTVQPGRGKKGICKVYIIACDWENFPFSSIPEQDWEAEARSEGFLTKQGFNDWWKTHIGPLNKPCWRIEFARPERLK